MRTGTSTGPQAGSSANTCTMSLSLTATRPHSDGSSFPHSKQLVQTHSTHNREFFASLINNFGPRWPHLPDKPEENADSGIRALWLAAANRNCSVQKAAEGDLPDLTPEQQNRLNELIEQ